jgi:hypothetical protein
MAQTFLELYSQYAEGITDAPTNYHKVMGMLLLGSVLKNKVFFPWGDTRLNCNMWVILLGESTWDRKSTAIGIPQRLLNYWSAGKLIYPNEFSYERLVATFAKRPCGVFFVDEFKTFAGLLNREYMGGARGFLTTMYDSPDKYTRELSNETFTIAYPSISIAVATTKTWFVDKLRNEDIEGGFIPRHLLVPADPQTLDYSFPPPACKETRGMLFEWMDTFADLSGPCVFSKEAREIHDRWYRSIRERPVNDRFAAFAGRLQGYLIKFSMFYEINYTQKLTVSGESMTRAVAMVEKNFRAMQKIESEDMARDKWDKDCQTILRHLKKANGWIDRSSLLRSTHLQGWQMDKAMDTLLDRDEVDIHSKREKGARKPRTSYRAKS